MDERRVAVTLANGRSHILKLPDGLAPQDAAAALRGEPGAPEWAEGAGEWLAIEQGEAWVRRGAIAEVAVVDYPEDPLSDIGYNY
jgi:hypothetical protein